MAASRQYHAMGREFKADESGQALTEFALILPTLLVLAFAMIDFGRALSDMQVMSGLTRQGSNLASRGTSLSASAAAVIAGDAPLNLNSNGEVIVTSVSLVNSVNTITGQASQGGISCSSKIGQGTGNPAAVPPGVAAMLQSGQTVYVTEVFYTYQPITPVGKLLNIVMPSTLYEAAYF